MTLNVAQICRAKYPGEVEKMNITFYQTDFDVKIQYWKVDGIPQPTEDELLKQSDTYEIAYNLIIFNQIGGDLVQSTIDTTAKSRQYNDGISCASYAQSTNPVWAAEAQAFIAWRDLMYAYMLEVYSDIQGGEPVPSQEELMAGFPEIVWP